MANPMETPPKQCDSCLQKGTMKRDENVSNIIRYICNKCGNMYMPKETRPDNLVTVRKDVLIEAIKFINFSCYCPLADTQFEISDLMCEEHYDGNCKKCLRDVLEANIDDKELK